ncbi:MAG: MerC domain-containing protein [Luteibacter sp.]|uniref:MerC domain-containing protein n=1 Tax=Luteibacter sp. TaxID=1886636 RepID=UPI002808D160|nr:MerC domain-containing protein [Luteibacter sp.]MDQ7996874.1 MerC domain-containing protein [Luteibacter sp.]MDQ8049245.1 MerC domain-containing protein [Luteibacter sp.]
MTRIASRQPSSSLDRFASFWAIGCAIHCLALPLVLFAVPSLYLALYSFASPHRELAMALLRLISLEPWFIATGAFISTLAMVRAWRRHRRAGPPALAAAGIATLFAAWYFAAWADGWMHTVGVLMGGALLVTAHTWNVKCVRSVRRDVL